MASRNSRSMDPSLTRPASPTCLLTRTLLIAMLVLVVGSPSVAQLNASAGQAGGPPLGSQN
jgi:hypothetical protein